MSNKYVMVKGKIGMRGRVLFDEIDLRIIQKLNHDNGMGVLELAKWMGIMHNNMKPHIDKLISLGLVSINQNNEGKAVLIAGKEKEQDIFLKYLANSNMYVFDKEMQKFMKIDLRTKEAKKFIKPSDYNPFKKQ